MERGGPVEDIVFLATIVAFFMLCVGYVWACGRIIGNAGVVDELASTDDDIVLPLAHDERAA
jgi:hypothetical protein